MTSQMTYISLRGIGTVLGPPFRVQKATNRKVFRWTHGWGQVTCLGILDFQRILSHDQPRNSTNAYKSNLLKVNMQLQTVKIARCPQLFEVQSSSQVTSWRVTIHLLNCLHLTSFPHQGISARAALPAMSTLLRLDLHVENSYRKS